MNMNAINRFPANSFQATTRLPGWLLLIGLTFNGLPAAALWGQAVCLPSPRLLTTMPMGGEKGTTLSIKITGQNIQEVTDLTFSHPQISAKAILDAKGQPTGDRFQVTIGKDCPTGVHEARVTTRLGISTSRAFSVGDVAELQRDKPNQTLETAMRLPVNSICNAWLAKQSVDHYSFIAAQGQRIIVDCGARGIDSKLKPVVIIADANGADLLVERRGGLLDFKVPQQGEYVVKVHDLTFNGGNAYFYRLAILEAQPGAAVTRMASTRPVNSFSWPPPGLDSRLNRPEIEPNDRTAQVIELPCDISGSFFPAADVDLFQFNAKKGEVWWVEVASERLGLPTDPSIVVQSIHEENDQQSLEDVAEFNDIASPVKVSSNGYSYDGPPYNAGSSDILGRLEIKRDGKHQLKISDLFGGTRRAPQNIYRLVIRKAQPDFSLVAWALHMNLRNGDRNALSKPISLRAGATMALEVVAVRRDGFDGAIDLKMENLPAGVTAMAVRIPAGKSRGIMLVSAHHKAPAGLTGARFTGEAVIDGSTVTRRCFWASMKWPVANAWSEIPNPRLLADVPVSVSDAEFAPLTLSPNRQDVVFEAAEGSKLTLPLVHSRRCDFSGASMSLRTFGNGFEKNPAFEASFAAEMTEVVLDLKKLKVKPGDYTVAFYGSAVAKYRDQLPVFENLQEQLRVETAEEIRLKMEQKNLADKDNAGGSDDRQTEDPSARIAETLKKVSARIVVLKQKVKVAQSRAAPKDIVDIVVSQPVRIRVRANGK